MIYEIGGSYKRDVLDTVWHHPDLWTSLWSYIADFPIVAEMPGIPKSYQI